MNFYSFRNFVFNLIFLFGVLFIIFFSCQKLSTKLEITINNDNDLYEYINGTNAYNISNKAFEYIKNNDGVIYTFSLQCRNGTPDGYVIDYKDKLLAVDMNEGYIINKKDGVLCIKNDNGNGGCVGLTEKQQYTGVSIVDSYESKGNQFKILQFTTDSEIFVKEVFGKYIK